MASAHSYISFRGVDFQYTSQGKSPTWILKDLNLEIARGEFYVLLGPSGCGKTTALTLLAGFEHQAAGAVSVDGRTVTRPGVDRVVIFQGDDSLYGWLTAQENVEFGLKMAGVDQSKRLTTARSLLDLAGLLSFENHYPDQLSGGMKQRIGIVRALATSPQVLLMDEPFGALDTQTRVVMQEILTNIWQQFRISVLFITHDIEESIFLSDRIYVMTARPGRIKAEIKVPLPRPRTAEMTDSPEFMNLVQELKGLIREESLAAMAPEIKDRGLSGFGMKVGPKGVGELY